MEKSLAVKLLNKENVSFEIYSYPESERDAEKIAVFLGIPAARVYKSLVVLRPKGKPMLVMLAADRQLNLKKLAKAVKVKKVTMATHAEAEKLTRLKVGGISPLLLLNRGFDIYIDEGARAQSNILISAGRKGTNLGVPVEAVVRLTGARFVDVSG